MPEKGGRGAAPGAVRKAAAQVPDSHPAQVTGSDEFAPARPGNMDLVSNSELPGDRIVLMLSDLLPDTNGDIVLSSAVGPMAVSIATDQDVVETGTAARHVTLGGVDVAGYQFCTFEGGVTVYYTAEIDLIITWQGA